MQLAKAKKYIPNFITVLNLICGIFAILFFIEAEIESGSTINQAMFSGCFGSLYGFSITNGIILILIATILDFLDGFLARILKVRSEIGAQLDSLADMVTFGVAPGFLFYAIASIYFPNDEWLKYLFVLIPAFSAIRLAIFNVDEEQTTYFKGLATPSNAIFWCGVAFLMVNYEYEIQSLNWIKYILAFLVIFMSLLMTSSMRMFSLKLKNFKLEGDNIYRFLLIGGSIVLTIIGGLFTTIFVAIPFIILLYIFLSIGYHISTKKRA